MLSYLPAQASAGIVEVALHSPGRDSEGGRHLLDVEAAEVEQAHGEALALGEGVERRAKVEQLVGQVGGRHGADGGQELLATTTQAPAAAQAVQRHTTHPRCRLVYRDTSAGRRR